MPSRDTLERNPEYAALIAKQPAPRSRLEDEAQIMVVAWLKALEPQYPALEWLHHSANESHGGSRVGGVPTSVFRNARMGVSPGFPDLALYHSSKGYQGLALELKIHPRVPSPDQDKWLEHLSAQGWYTAVCRERSSRTLADAAYLEICQYVGIN